MFDAIELEYAAFRRGVAVVDQTQRGCVQVAGADAEDLLERLLTQKIGDMKEGEVRDKLFEPAGKVGWKTIFACCVDRTTLSWLRMLASLGTRSKPLMRSSLAKMWNSSSLRGVRWACTGQKRLRHWLGLAAVEDAAEAVLLVDEPAHQGFEVFVRTDAVREFWTAVTAIENARPAGWFMQNLIRLEGGSLGSGLISIKNSCPMKPILSTSGFSSPKVAIPDRKWWLGCNTWPMVRPSAGWLVCISLRAKSLRPERQSFATKTGAPGEVLGQVTSSGPSPMASSRGIGLGSLVKAAQDASLLVVNEEGPGRVEVVERSALVPLVLRESKDESEEPNPEEPS